MSQWVTCSKLLVCAGCPLTFIIKRKRPKLSEGHKLKTESHGNVLRPLVSQLLNSTSSQSAILYFTSPSMAECELSALGNQAGVKLQTTVNDNIYPKFRFVFCLFFRMTQWLILNATTQRGIGNFKFNKVRDCRLYIVCIKYVSNIQNSPISGLSFCTKGGRLLAQERSSITSSTAFQPQTPVTNAWRKTKRRAKEKTSWLTYQCLH